MSTKARAGLDSANRRGDRNMGREIGGINLHAGEERGGNALYETLCKRATKRVKDNTEKQNQMKV